MTPKSMTKLEAAIRRGDDEYDAFADPEEVAKRRGQRVVFPEINQLQIDIDSDEQYHEFDRRLSTFDSLYAAKVEIVPSASGLPHRHITLTHPTKEFTTEQRLMWQAALNDDPVRVFLNALRHDGGDLNPSRFFEPFEVVTTVTKTPLADDPDNFVIPNRGMISAVTEAESKVFVKIQGKRETWYIPANSDERGGSVYVDTHNPGSNGFGGSILKFTLEDGSVDEVKGPWHSNSDALFRDTGVDIRNEHRTFVVLATGREHENGRRILTGVLYRDPEGGVVGSFDRYKILAAEHPEALTYYSESRGGSSSGPIK